MPYAIGVDVGGTSIKYGLVDSQGTLLHESIRPTRAEDSQTNVFESIRLSVQELTDFARLHSITIEGIGIGVPAIVDSGVIIGASGNLREINTMDLGALLAECFNCPVWIDNDANLMGLAEVRFGAARDITDAVFLTIGTGIGGALILNGKLFGGYRNRGTELGHICIETNGPSCTCGGRGCLEALASSRALVASYKELLDEGQAAKIVLDGKYIVARYLDNEKEAVLAMTRHFNYLAAGITGFINIFSPQKVIIGGGISESGAFYLEQIRKRVGMLVMKETAEFTRIEAAMLGNKAGFLGAAAMALENSSKHALHAQKAL